MAVVVVLLVVCGALVGRFLWYPCHPLSKWWGYSAFGEEGREARDALAKGRNESKQIKDEASRIVKEAKQRVEAEIGFHQQRLLERKKDQAELRQLKRGEHLPPDLWPLRLYEHALLRMKKTEEASEAEEPMGEPEWELSLDGLVAWLEPTQDNFYVRAKDRGGEQRSAPYSRTQYTEVEVDGFVERINNRVLNDRDFHRRRQDDKTVVASEISQITARIAKIREEGDRKVGDATERERVEQERAGSALKTAYDDWEEKAGLRPRLWW